MPGREVLPISSDGDEQMRKIKTQKSPQGFQHNPKLSLKIFQKELNDISTTKWNFGDNKASQ